MYTEDVTSFVSSFGEKLVGRPSTTATMSRNAFFLVVWLGLVAWLRHAASVGSSEYDEASPETNEPSVANEPEPETPKPSSARLVEPLYPPKPTLF